MSDSVSAGADVTTAVVAGSVDAQRDRDDSGGFSANRDLRMISPFGWVCIAAIAALFISLHWKLIERMFRIATKAKGESFFAAFIDSMSSTWSQDWSHILAIPFISLFFVIQNRRNLMAEPLKVFWPGLLLMLAGIIGYIFGIYPVRNDLFQGWSMVAGLFGLVIFLTGPRAMKVLWFPVVYLVLAIKIPGQIWEALASRLQHIAATSAGYLLKFLGIFLDFDTETHGNKIEMVFTNSVGKLVTSEMNVAEACAGLRMLMAFIALGVAIAFFFKRPLWQKLLICMLTLPVAVAVNVGRVTAIGLIHLVDPAYAQGDFHTMIGILMLIPAGLLFLLVGWIADRIIIRDEAEESDEDTDESLYEGPPPDPTWSETASDAPGSTRSIYSLFAGVCCGGVLMLLVGVFVYFGFAAVNPAMLGEGTTGYLYSYGGLTLVIVTIVAAYWVARTLSYRPAFHMRRFATAVAMGVLLVATLGFNAAIAMTEVVLIKQAVDMRDQFYYLPTSVGVPMSETGHWVKVGQDETMSPDILQELGTNLYLSRVYLRKGDSVVRYNANGKKQELSDVGVRLHLAYYTGNPDTVPHVPDRCFIGGGAEFLGRDRDSVIDLTAYAPPGKYTEEDGQWWGESKLARDSRVPSQRPGAVRVPSTSFKVTRFTYGVAQNIGDGFLPEAAKEEARNNTAQSTVIYFFAANGKLLAGPNDVRVLGFDPRDKYSYYCKIEVGVQGAKDEDESILLANEFLSVMMPEILQCLPDWVDVDEGRWPPNQISDVTSVSQKS